MERTEYLDQLHGLMKLMRFQTTLPVDEIDTGFFWRVSHLFTKVLLRAEAIGVITASEFIELLELSNEIRDCLEVACRERFPDRTPLFQSKAFRSAAKDAQGYPLQPVQLCDLLEQDVFKELPAIGQADTRTPSIVLHFTGRNSPIIRSRRYGEFAPISRFSMVGQIWSFKAWRLMADPTFRMEL